MTPGPTKNAPQRGARAVARLKRPTTDLGRGNLAAVQTRLAVAKINLANQPQKVDRRIYKPSGLGIRAGLGRRGYVSPSGASPFDRAEAERQALWGEQAEMRAAGT